MGEPAIDPRRILAYLPAVGSTVRGALLWASHRTGLPVVLVAAVTLVTSWRVFKRSLRLLVEVAFAVALLLAATRLGWIEW